MTKEQCPGCEYEARCWSLLKLKNRFSKEPCSNFRKLKTIKQTTLPTTDPK